jgi:hypothetical protein
MAELRNHDAESATTVYKFDIPMHTLVSLTDADRVWNAFKLRIPLTEPQMAEFPLAFELDDPPAPSRLDFFFTLYGLIGTSGRVRSVIEALEPGVHQFPALMYSTDDPLAPVPNGGDPIFYAMHCTESFDFIDIEASRLVKVFPSPMAGYKPSGAPLVTKPDWLRSRHLWRCDRQVMLTPYFVSHALKTALLAANLPDLNENRFIPIRRG